MTTTLVYRYGLASPHENRDVVLDQIRLAHRYRNTLVEIERGRRDAVRALLADAQAEIVTLTTAVEAADALVEKLAKEIRADRAKTRSRSDTEEQRARLKAARLHKADAVRTLREARTTLREKPEIVTAIDIIAERANELRKGARAYCGLGSKGPHFGAWGTYQLSEDAAQTSAAKIPLYDDDGISPSDPRFVRWTGEGAVSVQLQKGASLEDVTGMHRQLRLTLPDERAWVKEEGWANRRRHARHGDLAMRLGDTEDGTAVWARWRLDMHRPLPVGARIKRATASCRMMGPYARWSLELTVDAPDRPVLPATLGGAVALDIGWRVIGDELRVAGWSDEAGRQGELRLDAAMIRALHEPEEIRADRDKCFDAARIRLKAWLDNHVLPEWLKVETRLLMAWRSHDRLGRLYRRWAQARFAGDEIAFDSLEAWTHTDRHLHAKEARWRTGALRRRRELYRVFASQLVRQYDTIVLEHFDMRAVARRGAVESDAENQTARSNRQLASVSELRSACINAARSAGKQVVKMPATDTTRECPSCGIITDRKAAESVMLSCACGHAWDQDVDGAPLVMLDRRRERPGEAKIVVAARNDENNSENKEVKESRWARARKLRAEKEERMASARESASNSAE